MRKLSGSQLLLTGGSGFVGRYLVESVIRFNELSGMAPCILTIPSRQPDLLMSRYRRQVDAHEIVVVAGSEVLTSSLQGRHWDYVIHGAAPTDPARISMDPGRAYRESVGMTASVVDIARASDPGRVLFISSGAVYGDQPADLAALPETYQGAPDISTPRSAYGEAKRSSELLVRLSGLDYRIARVFSLVGPYQDLGSSFAVPDLIRQADGNGRLRTTGGGARRSYCYATDLAVFLINLLLSETPYDVFNVGCREGTASIDEVADLLASIFGGLEVERSAHGDPARNYVPDLGRMYEVYAPRVGLREALARTCQSLYARGLIQRQPLSRDQ
ncbi:MAG: NAD(P)-dependent oxidoreductase [Chloroflexi bacterium]|nr:NAD(P)-dependent oxidoreductase [Chloroflexota bacterium]